VATTSSWRITPVIVEEGVPFERCDHDAQAPLSLEAQVGPSRRRGSGRSGPGAGLGLAEEEAGDEDDEEEEICDV
jgi:hypothetical protein